MQAADCRRMNNHFQEKHTFALSHSLCLALIKCVFPFYKEMHSTAVYLIGTQPHWNWSEPNRTNANQAKPNETKAYRDISNAIREK